MSSVLGKKWHLLIAAGGAAAAGALLYYLLKSSKSEEELKEAKKKSVSEFTLNDVLMILNDITASQEKMKVIMRDITKKLKVDNLTFEETYYKVKEVQPDDPLERHGLTMQDFDAILERYQSNAGVREAINSILGAPEKMNMSSNSQSVKKETIVKVHQFMLDELKSLVEEFETLDKSKAKYDIKTVTIAAQAVVGAKVEEKFGLSSDDIECAVLQHHQSLATDSEFARINLQMQSTMSTLMGGNFPAGIF